MPKLLITLGDASGVGPEVIVKLLADHQFRGQHSIDHEIIGEQWILEETAHRLDLDISFCPANTPKTDCIKVHSGNILKPGDYLTGQISKACGNAAYQYFVSAIQRCMQHEADGIVSAPLCKEAMNKAGHHFIGHTEILERLTGATVVMTLIHPKLVVSHVTDHIPLRQALDAITPRRLKDVTRLTFNALKARGIASPKIAFAGINPHAGENGLLGHEENNILIPVIQSLVKEGMNILGPYPADTVFYNGMRGDFDGIIAMYHDQGFGPMKTLDLAHGVNCTLGIPFIRTSPDHGTAFDIAGSGNADGTSMLEAWKLAIQLLS
ncbi:MAG: 4-hydroxythreonine-4-phosphate dehydrogenase PdxA [Fibrobacteria bacterium]|nr:4-hydroxythreonine-4-phosphate dehydrogenase PdxA [Fibrobacteria bacterium]